MNKYPFLAACLPEIRVGSRPEISFPEVLDLLSLNTSKEDKEKLSELLRLIDLDNIKAFWLGLPLNRAGTMSAKELEEALLVKDFLPSFCLDFLDRYETLEERLAHFPLLYANLYQEMEAKAKGFVRDYYKLEREIRLVLMALRAKALGRDIMQELQFEDLYDPFVMQIAVQKDSPHYAAPQEYAPLQEIFEKTIDNPMALYLGILQYRFNRILEIEEQYPSFSIDRILGFLSRLMIVEMWSQLDRQKGLALVDDLSKNG